MCNFQKSLSIPQNSKSEQISTWFPLLLCNQRYLNQVEVGCTPELHTTGNSWLFTHDVVEKSIEFPLARDSPKIFHDEAKFRTAKNQASEE